MKNSNKIISTILIGTMFATTALPVFANTKEETVYSKINSKSEIYNTIVSDKISNDDKDEFLEDITSLLNIENTSGDETYTTDGDKIIWEAKGNDISYKGTTEEELPIDCKIKYELDGEEVEAEDLVGKEGNVKITLEYTNNEKHLVNINGKQEVMYTPFVIVAGTIIDNENNSDIKITTGKLIDNGDKTIAIGLAMPGLSESLAISEDKFEIPSKIEIEMNAKDFEMNNIMAYATPKLLDSDELNIFDNLDEIYDQVNTLQESSKQLVSGSNEVNEGAKKLQEGAKSLNSGTTSAYNGAKTIKTEVAKSTSSLVNDKSDALDKNTIVSIGKSASSTAIATITSKQDAIGNQASSTAQASISTKLDAIGSSASQTAKNSLKDQLNSIGLQAKSQAQKEIEGNLEQIGNSAKESVKNITLTQAQITAIKQQVKTNLESDATYLSMPEETRSAILQYSQASAVSAAEQTAKSTATSVAGEVAKSTAKSVAGDVASKVAQSTATSVAGSVAEETAKSTATSVAGEVASSTAKSTATSVAGEVANSTAQTVAGSVANQVKSAALDKVATQMQTLSAGLEELTDGLSTLNQGTETLEEGTTSLQNGTNELAQGMLKFDEQGIEKICNYINGDIKDLTNRLEKLKELAEEYKTFTKINDDDNGTVKFIMIVDSLKKEE